RRFVVLAAEASDVGVTEVVCQDEDEVRLAGRLGRRRGFETAQGDNDRQQDSGTLHGSAFRWRKQDRPWNRPARPGIGQEQQRLTPAFRAATLDRVTFWSRHMNIPQRGRLRRVGVLGLLLLWFAGCSNGRSIPLSEVFYLTGTWQRGNPPGLDPPNESIR